MTLMVPGWCFRCGKPLGPVAWDAADFTWCKPCAKAAEVYTSPDGRRGGRPVRPPRGVTHITMNPHGEPGPR